MQTLDLDLLTVPAPPPGPADWNEDGVVLLPGFIDDELIAAYKNAWLDANHTPPATRAGDVPLDDPLREWKIACLRPGGWPDCTPYMRHPEILDLCAPLAPVLEQLVGDQMGMNLNLTSWVSTDRDWHQDSYLNEPDVGDWYAAVWIALGEVHPDSGPFQYVPGSHRWPQVTREKIRPHVDMSHYLWPKHSEVVLSPLFTDLIAEREANIVTHLPQKGDVLIWHGRLLHRGSTANVPGSYRPGFIAHFSGVNHRPQMPTAREHPTGGFYFPIRSSGPVS